MRTLLTAVALSLFTVLPAVSQISEMNGTWLLNTETSIGPAPTWEKLVYTITEGEQRYTMDAIDENGRESHVEWAVKYDGRDHPTSSGSPGTTTSIRKLSANSELVINKRDGAVTGTYTRVLVDDNQTILSIGRDPDGKISWVRAFDKQE
jgi:hypothetical protein